MSWYSRAGRVARNAFTTVGVLTVAGGLTGSLVLRKVRNERVEKSKKLPEEFVLNLDFHDIELVERASPFKSFRLGGPSQVELRDLLEALKAAGQDERVKGLFTVVSANQQFEGLGQVQEIRQSILDFKNTKGASAATLAYADSFGEGSKGMAPYYLASACEKVFMQPTGYVSITGVAAETPFIRRLLDLLNIKPTFFRREAYKNFANQFTHETYNEPHREALSAILTSWMTQMVEGIATSRNITTKQVHEAIDNAPLSPEKAISRNILDGSKYRDQVVDLLPKKSEDATKNLPSVSVTKYMKVKKLKAEEKNQSRNPMKAFRSAMAEDSDEEKDPADNTEKSTVAVLSCLGPILAGDGGGQQRGNEIHAKKVSQELEKIRKNKNVKALVLRVDSPGGSAVGSDTIYRQVLRVKEAGKPVIVSMGNIAGSGGYYIAAPASKIVADPATITGSIGVVNGKFNLDGLARKYGVDMERLSQGKNAESTSSFYEWTEDQVAQIQVTLDEIYLGFMEKVALGRGKSIEEVRKIAGGRIWSGSDALKVGLVDKLGGIQDAILLAKQEAGLPLDDDSKVEVVDYPRKKAPFAILLSLLSGNSASAEIPLTSLLSSLWMGNSEVEMLSNISKQFDRAQDIFDDTKGPQLIIPELEATKLG